MSRSADDRELLAAIARALPHVDDARADTQAVVAFPSPDGRLLVVLYDAWEFHMGATTEKVALADRDAAILRLFPFECVNTGVHVCAWREDGAMFALSLGGTVVLWSLGDRRFALARADFTPSSVAFEEAGLKVLESNYRVGKDGHGYYADGPKGARFAWPELAWHDQGALERWDELAEAAPRVPAAKV